MPTLTIDQRTVEVPAGATILEAARALGIDIPTLCYLEGYDCSTSCLVCMVKDRKRGRLMPSCATPAAEGMEIESETEEVHAVRRTALELLLSDHVGDCLAPCSFACPAHMDVPTMLREIAGHDHRQAIATVKHDIALPAVLGRICPKPCEKGCRRAGGDQAVTVCQMKRLVADADLASGTPYLPPRAAPTGRRVAIVGGGPTGLSAAYYLALQGHTCVVFDQRAEPGGRLWDETTAAELPREILRQETASLLAAGIEYRGQQKVSGTDGFAALRREFDAVLVAWGATSLQEAAAWGLKAGPKGIEVDRETFATNVPGVFAAGNALRGKGLVVRSAADGKEAAVAIGQFLAGQPVTGVEKPFSVRMGRLQEGELPILMACASHTPRQEPASGQYEAAAAADQAGRCLHCDCRALHSCKLRQYAEQYHADPQRYGAPRRRFEQYVQPSGVIYEPGKCIDCGLCIQIAARAGEPLGLTFIGRGFDVRIGAPLNRSFAEALQKVAAECVAACPTAALAMVEPHGSSGDP